MPLSGIDANSVARTGARTSFAGELVSSLEDSTQVPPHRRLSLPSEANTFPIQSDSTRHSALELKIQNRVTDELQRLADEESTRLAELTKAASAEVDASPPNSAADSDPTLLDKLSGEAARKTRLQQLSRESVSKEIAELRRKLDARKRLEQPDPGVERAKNELVTCLRMHDRRPLDCWREKEEFKRQVGRLEREFVERTVR